MAKRLNKDCRCQGCGGKNCVLIALLHNWCRASIVRCRDCGLTFVVKDKVALAGQDYFQNFDLDKYSAYYQQFRTNYFRKHLAIIEQLVPKGRILDFGCSFGWFLKLAKDSGWQCFGFEPSERVAKEARENYGLNIASGDMEIISSFNSDFQAISLWNVLEHTAEPLEVLSFLYSKLSPGGLLAIAVPNQEGLISRVAFWLYRLSFGKFYFLLNQLYQSDNPYMHLFHFSEKTLTRLLEKSGFKVVKAFRQPAVDSRRLSDRIKLDRSLNSKPRLVKAALLFAAKLGFYLSEITNLQDEIVLYARKVKDGQEKNNF